MQPLVTARRIEPAVRSCAAGAPVVLAVSGGQDSMVLLHAAARALAPASVVVATFDHGTGRAATRAARHVAAEALTLGVPVVTGHATGGERSEAAWRDERWRFLREVAAATGGRVMTAHTRDDQVETILMRVMRGAGARGLAAMHAGDALRPLLGFTRAEIERYAREHGIRWVEDPANASPDFLRNRVRRDLLPALRRVAPGLDASLLDASARAAAVRREVDGWVEARADVITEGRHVAIAVRELAGRAAPQLCLLWPAIAARVGLALDRRGTARAAAFTTSGRVGARMPLSGGWEIVRSRDRFDLWRSGDAEVAEPAPLSNGVTWGALRFAREATVTALAASDAWVAWLPENAGGYVVRAWQPGDRLRVDGLDRRVKRYLSDAGITGAARRHWPVVVDEQGRVIWIPGVRRSDAASVRPGRPGQLIRCDDNRR